MIWTIALWMAMQGQVDNACAQTPPSLCFYKGCEKMAAEIDGGCPVYTDAPTQFKPLTPVEHVFEIRAETEDHGTAKDERGHGLGGTPHCDDPEDVLESPNQCHEGSCTSMYIVPHCVRITRELWMDGKRLGIIKGLD